MNGVSAFVSKNPTVAVSIVAAFFTFLTTIAVTWINYWTTKRNLDRQLKVHIASTVKKEWINDVRSNVGTIVYQALNNAASRAQSGKLNDEITQLFSSEARLKLLLDKSNPLHNEVIKEVSILIGQTLTLEKGEDVLKIYFDQTDKVVRVTHDLFESMGVYGEK